MVTVSRDREEKQANVLLQLVKNVLTVSPCHNADSEPPEHQPPHAVRKLGSFEAHEHQVDVIERANYLNYAQKLPPLWRIK